MGMKIGHISVLHEYAWFSHPLPHKYAQFSHLCLTNMPCFHVRAVQIGLSKVRNTLVLVPTFLSLALFMLIYFYSIRAVAVKLI